MATQRELDQIYQQYFGRNADPEGLAFWSPYDVNSARTNIGIIAAGQRPQFAAPNPRKAFSEIVPENYLDPFIQQLAESQVNPEVNRQKQQGLADYYRNMASSGGFRSGVGKAQGVDLGNQFERQRMEQTQGFYGDIKNYTTDYYNQMYETYNKNPNAFVAPQVTSYQDFLTQNPTLSNLYTTQAGTSKSPYLF